MIANNQSEDMCPPTQQQHIAELDEDNQDEDEDVNQ